MARKRERTEYPVTRRNIMDYVYLFEGIGGCPDDVSKKNTISLFL